MAREDFFPERKLRAEVKREFFSSSSSFSEESLSLWREEFLACWIAGVKSSSSSLVQGGGERG